MRAVPYSSPISRRIARPSSAALRAPARSPCVLEAVAEEKQRQGDPAAVSGLLVQRARRARRGRRLVRPAQIAQRPGLGQPGSRHHQGGPALPRLGRRPHREIALGLEVAERLRGQRLGQLDARVLGRGGGQLAHGGQGDTGIARLAGRDLRARQAQAVLEVVGEERPQCAIDLDRLRPFPAGLAEASLDGEALLPRHVARRLRTRGARPPPPWRRSRARSRLRPMRPGPAHRPGPPSWPFRAASARRGRRSGAGARCLRRRGGPLPRSPAGRRAACPPRRRRASPHRGSRAGGGRRATRGRRLRLRSRSR